jgi:hypothetical protein
MSLLLTKEGGCDWGECDDEAGAKVGTQSVYQANHSSQRHLLLHVKIEAVEASLPDQIAHREVIGRDPWLGYPGQDGDGFSCGIIGCLVVHDDTRSWRPWYWSHYEGLETELATPLVQSAVSTASSP